MSHHVGLRVGDVWRRSVAGLRAWTIQSGDVFPLLATGPRLPMIRAQYAAYSTASILPHPISTSNGVSLGFRHTLALPRLSRKRTLHDRQSNIYASVALGWRRLAHNKTKRKQPSAEKRNKSSVTNGSLKNPQSNQPVAKAEQSSGTLYNEKAPTPRKEGSTSAVGGATATSKTSGPKNGSKTTAQAKTTSSPLLNRLPDLSHLHRPTKEELLAAATGFWSRLKVHFKWFSIKSSRPFNIDDISAFFSWILVGHVVWIIVGTTTFFSLVIWFVNTVFAQETIAQWVGDYLTQSSGVKVIFESAVVPKWKDGVISFKNVFVSRRPGQGQSKVSKGDPTSAAVPAIVQRDQSSGPEDEDTNYTQFDVSIDTVNVTLSFAKWFNGKGLLRDVEVKGIRGVIDRTSVQATAEYVDPRIYKHEHHPGDFELDSFKMEDLLVTVYQTKGFRPYSVSIYSCHLPQLRKRFLFYDFLSANVMSGSFDNSLFTIHPRQTHSITGLNIDDGGQEQWKRHSRLRMDGLHIDHLNRGVEGPFGWIREGNVDIVADIMIPADDDASIAKYMSDFYDRVEATVTSENFLKGTNQQTSEDGAELGETVTKIPSQQAENDDDKRFMIMDLRVHFNDVRAGVPVFTRDISYVNNALIRPIVAYINSKRAFIPLHCRVVKRYSEFDGSWTIYDSGLMEDLSREMYEAFARDVLHDHQSRNRRLKKVGFWTLQLAAQALFIGMAGNIA